MRKWVLVLLMLVMWAIPSMALQEKTEIISGETLTGVSDTVSADHYVADAKRVTFFVTYDQGGSTVAVTTTVTVAVSVDGINWHDISWFDAAGGATPQTSEQFTVDATYAGWMFRSLATPYIRIRATASGEVGMSADVTVTLIADK